MFACTLGLMPDDLRSFDAWFYASQWPSALCPVCKKGDLQPKKESIKQVTTANYDQHRDDDGWEPDWEHGFFHGVLYCGRPQCSEKVIVSGQFRVKEIGWYEYGNMLRLRYAIPAFPLAVPPSKTPQAVLSRLEEASRIVWTDPSAAANGLRRCVEALLNHQKVRKTFIDRRGKRVRLSTHDRIREFKAIQPSASEALEAVKWVGNQGSHSSSVLTSSDCIQSAEHLEHALRILFDTKDVELARRARAINKAKGVKRPSTQLRQG